MQQKVIRYFGDFSEIRPPKKSLTHFFDNHLINFNINSPDFQLKRNQNINSAKHDQKK